jgi:hypothetical protein
LLASREEERIGGYKQRAPTVFNNACECLIDFFHRTRLKNAYRLPDYFGGGPDVSRIDLRARVVRVDEDGERDR